MSETQRDCDDTVRDLKEAAGALQELGRRQKLTRTRGAGVEHLGICTWLVRR